LRHRPRQPYRLGVLISTAVSLLAPSSAIAQAVEGAGGSPLRILDVPYLTQTAELCGGAAAAMVLRYWGEPAATADFAPLVDARAHGIPSSALLEALRRPGFSAVAFRADRDTVREQLGRGRPVIGLIGVAPGRFHYVVILAWANERVLVHDPADAPFRVYREADLVRAWRASEAWAVVVARAEAAPAELAPEAALASRSPDPCGALVEGGVARARAGEIEPAEASLRAAAALCPDSAAPLLELAGLRFQSQQWREAADLAQQASRLDPNDTHAWRTLAASRYLAGDGSAALSAFNRLGEPKLGLLRVEGLARTRFAAVEKRVAAAPETLLTPRRLEQARRRVADIPALRSSRVSYRPTSDAHADLEVAVVERARFPGVGDMPRLAARAWNEREIDVGFASPTGAGEHVRVAWRFWEPRPAFGLEAALPQPLGAPVTLRTRIRWDTQSYAVGETPAIREHQREIALAVSDWALAGVKWELGASLQRFRDRASFLGPTAALETRAAAERLAVRFDAAALFPIHADADGFASLRLGGAWRSAPKETALLRLTAGWEEASSGAPLAAWSGAGTGAGRGPLLRAHPLLEDGVVTGSVFGRRLLHGSLELEPVHVAAGVFGLAFFADAGRATRRDAPGAASHVDAGVGLRLRLPGGAGAVRVDFARGLRDGANTLSAGWVSKWPALTER